ncbi:MAG: mechanosensitive ion channel family protein [Chloroflexi bacterium]|nr:mechanosensitive ion channel family protein [Chloroflexota bacterium]MBI2980403.1 mechanosensitive ion channel family protein [Chloroflexota bacterium]
MMELWQTLSEQQALMILVPIGVAVFVTALCLVLWKFLYQWLARWAKKANRELADTVLRSTRGTLVPLCFVAGIYAGIRVSGLPEAWMGVADKLMLSLLIISIALAIASLATIGITSYARQSRIAMPVTSLAQNAIRGLILLLGALVLLDTLNVKITSLIAALGIGTLAVALALQDTLSNVFAGAYIILSRNIKAGDYIKVDSGVEGYVVDIGWRATTIRPFENTIVIIPNSKLSQSVVTNYNLPEPWIQVAIPINVSYDTDIEKLERVLIEEGKRAITEVPGMLTEFEPVVRFMPGFGDFSLNFVFVFRVKQYVEQYFVQHELRKRILKRFRQEGIEIPFPIRTIRMSTNQTESKGGIDAGHKSDENTGAIS